MSELRSDRKHPIPDLILDIGSGHGHNKPTRRLEDLGALGVVMERFGEDRP